MFTLAAWLRMAWNTVSETTEKVIFAVFKQRIQVTGTKMGGMMGERKTRCRDCTYKKMLMFPLNPHGMRYRYSILKTGILRLLAPTSCG